MRVVTWNINGVRTLPQYHPWNTLKTFDDILNHLEADILCFQEMKSSRQALPKPVAVPPSFDAFFSFPIRKTGYSGIGIYTRRSAVVALKAEEGLTGLIQPKPPFTTSERISSPDTYPPSTTPNPPIPEDEDEIDYKDLDSEGRAVVLDLGLFVLISVYCPNDGTGTEERGKFKMDYHRLLEARVTGLVREGREVMVVGDLNACAAVEDHCEGHLMVERGLAEGLKGEEGFWGVEYRRWIRDWLVRKTDEGTRGSMVDIVRQFWPERRGMYTCWNTKISARDTNYGTRIDFVLITPGLVPWIKAADIQPHIKGSDHCPVFVDLRDEIVNPDGSVTKLQDVLGARPTASGPAEPPRIAAKFWDEHKQKLLSTFFGKQAAPATTDTSSTQSVPSRSQSPKRASQPPVNGPPSSPPTMTPTPSASGSQPHSQSQTSTSHPFPSVHEPPNTNTSSSKRKLVPESPDTVSKKSKATSSQPPKKEKEKKAGQGTIASFFAAPKASSSKSSTSRTASSTSMAKSKAKGKAKADESTTIFIDPATDEPHCAAESQSTEVDEDADYRFALLLSQSDDALPTSQSSDKDHVEKKQIWNTLLAPTQAPLCTVHCEPAREFTVNKPGPNKGKRFFLCSRPVGPGYDRGRTVRLREQVDPQWKCDFFKWSSDARKEMTRNGNGSGSGIGS
ncbi:hypothetical protein GALMADRAFT_75643 [Galerina marginata CBS 339.88]|uniref:DNA-(apurinic or apyrimidinic site) endonuclease 2 n=1 Tax=Galerina marginata (strain CBS 339.88) TaxID=685588 RepID=A0A067SLT3_GALM3|nr:hypothetical protein GALMADRAFT_75643 [Galerina marginata CBS 339.88]